MRSLLSLAPFVFSTELARGDDAAVAIEVTSATIHQMFLQKEEKQRNVTNTEITPTIRKGCHLLLSSTVVSKNHKHTYKVCTVLYQCISSAFFLTEDGRF